MTVDKQTYNERYELYKASADVCIDGSKGIDEVAKQIFEEFSK